MSWFGWPKYQSVDQKRKANKKALEKLRRKKPDICPIQIENRTIASSFWGKAWCRHMNGMAEEENRLGRGRSYACHGAILDLRASQGQVDALVNGSNIYTVSIRFDALSAKQWESIRTACQGKVATMLDLLQGKLSKDVMAVVCNPEDGLFPLIGQTHHSCSCPDHVSMCKHVAAVIYGIGNRLDTDPELLFRLRHVDPAELFSMDVEKQVEGEDALQGTDLGALFGIEMAESQTDVKPEKLSAASGKKRITRTGIVTGKLAKKPVTADRAPRQKKKATKK